MKNLIKLFSLILMMQVASCKTDSDYDSSVLAGTVVVELMSKTFKFKSENLVKDRAEMCFLETDIQITCWLRTKNQEKTIKPTAKLYKVNAVDESSDDREDLVTDLSIVLNSNGESQKFKIICTSILPYAKGGSSENEAFSCLNNGSSKLKFQ